MFSTTLAEETTTSDSSLGMSTSESLSLFRLGGDIVASFHAGEYRFMSTYDCFILQDYNLVEMSVLQMVPVSFGKCARAQTTATGVRPFTAAGTTPLDNGSSFSARTISALRREVDIFKRRRHMLEVMKVCVNALTYTLLL